MGGKAQGLDHRKNSLLLADHAISRAMYRFSMISEDDASTVVIRFSSFTEQGFRKNVDKQILDDRIKGLPERHGLSVFGTARSDDESIEDAVDRLCIAVKGHASGDRVAFTTEQILKDKGYALHLVEPPPGHYLVGNEVLTLELDLEGLVEAFQENRRKNPAFGKG